ncbi:MAG TPA: M20/M25/M40 family metallo-hydrolase [Nitrospiria bacterium]|nr:M20/M25/M40 family metallo-hydrolase [Candidatus Manganitrophaceae bacterium]HIL35402.1 M20/M25/M40 family metallo-hydrolase [Candidatus Manganitrophaceae bacterium]
MINTDRMIAHFLKLVQIDSHSRKEGKVALQLKSDLEALGAEVVFDEAGEAVGGEVGNLIARIPGTSKGHAPLLLSAHMDTVVPGEGIKPVIEGKIIKSDGTTILGGDDKSGIAIIIEVLRVIREEKAEHGEIEVVLTICEEDGLVGAKHLDYKNLHARNGLVLDCDRVDFLFTKSPASDRMEFIVHGLEAHSGLAPEAGVSAIQIASEAISRMRLGRIDSETTANIGLIEGGSAVNIIPKCVRVKGESRSRDEEKLEAQTAHMSDCFQEAAAKYFVEIDGKRISGRVEEKIWRDYNKMNLSDATPIVKSIMRAAKRLSVCVQTQATGGGCDANIFNEKGIVVANLGTGMHAIHTVREWVHIDEMSQSARMVLEVVKDPP